MNVRLYRVSIDDFGECEVQASGRAGARWRAFQIGREAGYFGAGFRDFIARRPRVAELKICTSNGVESIGVRMAKIA